MPGPRVSALIAKLEKGQRKTEEILAGLSNEQWRQVVYSDPYPWTMRDLLAHFMSSEIELLRLAQDVASGGSGAPEGFDYNGFNASEHRRLADQDPATLISALADARARTLGWLQSVEEGDLDRPGRHPALGEVTLETILMAIYGHVLFHMRDAQRVMLAD
jgi:hypothetical protein